MSLVVTLVLVLCARIHALRRARCAPRSTTSAWRAGSASTSMRVFAITFALGSGLAGLGGALAIEIVGLDHAFAFTYLVYVLIVVSVGGLGSIGGSFVAASLLGISDMAGKYYFPGARRLSHLSGDGHAADVAAGRLVRETLAMASSPAAEPQRYLEDADPLAADRDRVLARDAAAVRALPQLSQLASQIAITALFALSLDLILGYAGIVSLGHAAYFGFGSYTAGLLAKWGWGEPLSGLLIAAARRRPARLSHELHHRALPPSRADHDHARLRTAARRGGQQRELADRRRRRPARRADVEAARRLRVRSLRLRRLQPIRSSCCS